MLKTEYQKEREKRDWAIYKEYTEMMRIKGQKKTPVMQFIMKKHCIHSRGTIYEIIRRIEQRKKTTKEETI